MRTVAAGMCHQLLSRGDDYLCRETLLPYPSWVRTESLCLSLALEIQEKFKSLTCLGCLAIFLLFGALGLQEWEMQEAALWPGNCGLHGAQRFPPEESSVTDTR